jgi:L-lactate dehydrogenase complex protein LldF
MPFVNPKPYQEAARSALENPQLRRNLGKATTAIREKRLRVVAELPDWQALRDSGAAIKKDVMQRLPELLLQLEASVQKAGGQVHWAADALEANAIVSSLVKRHNTKEVIKIKSLTTDEIGLNDALELHGIQAIETDLAELIVQLAHDHPSHILVPAIHKNRAEIRELFLKSFHISPNDLSDDPKDLAKAARRYLRQKFLETPVAISGANFAIAETGTVGVVESEGNGRMCLTLPNVLISIMGIEKVLPQIRDLEVMLQLLPRSSTAERMNPYTSLWTGVHDNDGPKEFHLVLLDNGRTQVLSDEVGRQTLHCIRCSACLNVCPVYERAGGHAYGSVYPGPIGAILTPQLNNLETEHTQSLPFASSLCGACYEVCPVKINIPEILVYLRGQVTEKKTGLTLEATALKSMAWVFADQNRYELAQKAARVAQIPLVKNNKISSLPSLMAAWTNSRDLPSVPKQAFRDWWRTRGQS